MRGVCDRCHNLAVESPLVVVEKNVLNTSSGATSEPAADCRRREIESYVDG